ncbi:MAG: YbdD/YjiX family protein [Proteobacteria bacterium]|nr:YbdD/YjiX family protein [Pseudomonadota bacterium]
MQASILSKIVHTLTKTARLMVGIPDYQTYVVHHQNAHPGEPVMSREDFFRERQARRYGANGGKISRCC